MLPPGQRVPARTILVTGFGAFPGSPRNPTEAIIAQLSRHRSRLKRLGVDLRCVTLPVRYAGLRSRLEALATEYRPDVILHLGVAGRRRRVSVETRAVNRAGPLHPDASGRCPSQVLSPFRESILRATYPSRRVLTALKRAGVEVETSRDAGDYVCNATLYHSLASRLANEIGFIHVPRARRPMTRHASSAKTRPSQADLADVALQAVLVLVRPSWRNCLKADWSELTPAEARVPKGAAPSTGV